MVDTRFVVSVVLLAVASACLGHPVVPVNYADNQVQVSSYESANTDEKVFFRYVLTDGQEVEQTIELDPAAASEQPQGIRVNGYYQFVDPTGKRFKVTYTADQGGTRASVELEPSVSFTPLSFSAPAPSKIQDGDGIGCALRASLCG